MQLFEHKIILVFSVSPNICLSAQTNSLIVTSFHFPLFMFWLRKKKINSSVSGDLAARI